MHTAHLTLAPTGPSIKQGDYEYHTPCLFSAIGPNDADQSILLVSKAAIPGNAKLIDCIGMLRFGTTIDTVQLHAEVVTPVLVTPDWGNKHPWSNKDGLVQRHAYITLEGNLGGADSFRSNTTAKGEVVMNCSIASRDQIEILNQNFGAKPNWFKITFWGKSAITNQELSPGQKIQFLSGVLSFQHWKGNNGEDMLSVGINARTVLKGASPSGIPGRDGEAPPVDAEATEQAGPPVTEEVPPAPLHDYADLPM